MLGGFGRRHIVCVFGSYSSREGGRTYAQAYAIGAALARAGYVVANGGYDGTMEASARGAKEAGGTTVGVTCSAFNNARGQAMTANRYIDHEIHHHHVMRRIKCMMTISSGFVVLPGGTGALSELALTWEYICKHLITPRPMYIVGPYWRPMIEQMIHDRPRSGQHIHFVDSPEEIVQLAALHIHGDPPYLSLIEPLQDEIIPLTNALASSPILPPP